jgi:hypothetical protein
MVSAVRFRGVVCPLKLTVYPKTLIPEPQNVTAKLRAKRTQNHDREKHRKTQTPPKNATSVLQIVISHAHATQAPRLVTGIFFFSFLDIWIAGPRLA